MRRGVTDAGRTTNIEDRATEPMENIMESNIMESNIVLKYSVGKPNI